MGLHRTREDHTIKPGDIQQITVDRSVFYAPGDYWVRFVRTRREFDDGGVLLATLPEIIAPVAPPRRAMLRRGKGRRR